MMWPFNSTEHDYHAIATDEVEVKETGEVEVLKKQECMSKRQRCILRATVGILLILLTVAGVIAVVSQQSGWFDPSGQSSGKTSPSEIDHIDPTVLGSTGVSGCRKRREWRTLDDGEKQQYISAVLCLLDQPSKLAPSSNHTAYEDWPWIHSHVGYHTHHSATFLPWHRYFLHLYESTLRDKCAYHGGLVYWDWTLDCDALEDSPIFDPDTGFGGDGEQGGEITVSNTGRCVADGPFAGITADYYDVKYFPHCLSRGFRDLDGSLGHIDGSDITPESIEEVLSSNSYEEFVDLMESRLHDVIPYGISGDFETFTAPYDPIFFLHHTQLDRLWWLWQLRQPGGGLTAFGGPKLRHSVEMASLDDLIQMQGLAEPVKVADVMDIHGGFLCYDY